MVTPVSTTDVTLVLGVIRQNICFRLVKRSPKLTLNVPSLILTLQFLQQGRQTIFQWELDISGDRR